MSSVVESIVLFLIKQVLTESVVKEFEKQVVLYLKKLAADSSNKVDDYMVQVIADALGVQV